MKKAPKQVYGVISSDVYGLQFYVDKAEAKKETRSLLAQGADDARVEVYALVEKGAKSGRKTRR